MPRRLISTGSPFEKAAGYSRAVIDRDFAFVAGLPVQGIVAGMPILQVPLLSGEAILVGPGRADYKLTR